MPAAARSVDVDALNQILRFIILFAAMYAMGGLFLLVRARYRLKQSPHRGTLMHLALCFIALIFLEAMQVFWRVFSLTHLPYLISRPYLLYLLPAIGTSACKMARTSSEWLKKQ